MKHYLIIVWGDVEPQLCGPFPTQEARDQEAYNHRSEDTEMKDGMYMLDIDDIDPDWDSRVSIDSYSGGSIMDEEDEENTMTNHYQCVCGHEWTDRWSCACDDDCPICGRTISPHLSE